MAKLLGVDVGTSSAKAVLVDERGSVLKSASAEYSLSTPRPLWSEQDPELWVSGVASCLRQIGERRPDAIGLTGQMHGAVVLDAQNNVIRPAILWNDQRTSEESAEIDRIVGKSAVRRITCNPPLTGFQAPKLLWLRRHEPEAFARIRSVLLPKDYVRLRLTGHKHTDVSDAAGTALFDVPQRAWSFEMIERLGLAAGWFPPVAESWEPVANTLPSDALDGGIPVVAGAGDQAAAAVGTGAVETGVVSVSLGTSGVVFTSLEEPKYDLGGRAHTFCHANGAWHAMGVMLSCGGALRWFRDTFWPGAAYEEIESLAAEAPPGADGLTFLPYLAGERTPHNDSTARGAFAGATLMHSRAHHARAVFEGLTFGLLDCWELLRSLGAECRELRVNGGGARSPFWTQLIADVFQTPCARLEVDEGPALGAAVLAGVGVGVWPNVAEASRSVAEVRSRVEPGPAAYGKSIENYRRLYVALKGWFRIL